MLVGAAANPAETGSNGVAMAAQAEKLEALMWEQVLNCMTKTAFGGGSLGTGSEMLNGLATQAMAGSMFGSTDSALTQQIVGQLQEEGSQGTADDSTGDTTGDATSSLSALMQLQSAVGSGVNLGTTPARGSGTTASAQALSFAKSVWPSIKTQAAQLGVPPVALLAQSALETGWGASVPGNNLFGIKAVSGQSATLQKTSEEVGGTLQSIEANFASYGSSDACVDQYAALIRRAYPQAVGAASVAQYAQALVQGGYATDSGYAQKVVATAQSPTMQSVLTALEGDTQ